MVYCSFVNIFFYIYAGYKGMNDKPTYATESTAAILMLVFQYVEEGREC